MAATVNRRRSCLLLRHPIAGNGTYSFDIADCRIRAIDVVRHPEKLRRFPEHTH
jgi:hypothetical protein